MKVSYLKEQTKFNIITKLSKIDLISFCLLFIAFTFYFFATIDYAKSLAVYIGFFLIGLISLFVFCFFDSFISIIKIVFCFIFIFFCIAPSQQYTYNYNAWNHINFNDSDYMFGNFLVLSSVLLILFFYIFFMKRKREKRRIYIKSANSNFTINNFVLICITIFNFTVLFYEYLSGSLITFENSASDSIMASLSKIIRFIPVASMIILTYNFKKHFTFIIFFVINALIVGVLFFPLSGSVPRFLLFGTYLILFYPIFNRLKLKVLLPIFLLFGFIVVFPTFNFFKTHTIFELNEFDFFINDSLLTADFDAYQLLLETVAYTKINGYLYGSNILTAILFFVPRSIWEGKCIHSGQLVAEFFKGNFTNLSSPFVAEFYLAFGLFGVIIFSIFTGFMLSKFEKMINSQITFKKGISVILFGMLIYLLRGALLPTVSYTMALIISFIIVYYLFYFLKSLDVRLK